MTYSDFKRDLDIEFDKVTEDHKLILVTRGSGKAAVIMSLEDFESYEETNYLKSDPRFMMEERSRMVQVRMRDATIAQADRLKEKIHAPSRSDAIRRAIELSDALTTAIEQGDKIMIEGKGIKTQVLIPGLLGEK